MHSSLQFILCLPVVFETKMAAAPPPGEKFLQQQKDPLKEAQEADAEEVAIHGHFMWKLQRCEGKNMENCTHVPEMDE